MPTIEISQEQANLLARGKDITVAAVPLPERTFIVKTATTKNTYKVTSRTPPTLEDGAHGRCVLLTVTSHTRKPGQIQGTVTGPLETIIEIDPEAVKL